jgi:hypothetical protein
VFRGDRGAECGESARESIVFVCLVVCFAVRVRGRKVQRKQKEGGLGPIKCDNENNADVGKGASLDTSYSLPVLDQLLLVQQARQSSRVRPFPAGFQKPVWGFAWWARILPEDPQMLSGVSACDP